MSDKIPIPPRKRELYGQAPIKQVPEKPKGGRPSKYPDKPWEAEGISRQTWYARRRKAGKE